MSKEMPAKQTEQAWYSTTQVADLLGVGRNTVKAWAKEGKLQGVLIGGSAGYRFSQEAIDDFTRRRMLRDALNHELAKAS